MITGKVVVNQTPMLMTFDDEEVDYICEVMEQSISMAYNVVDMFNDRDEEWSDEW